MSNLKIKCADAGSENCPCYLAEAGKCLVCNRIRGINKCECHWSGVCILSQFIFAENKPSQLRKEFTADILSIEYLQQDFAVLTVSVPKRFAAACSAPGTYIIVRNAKKNHFFDTPISIMAADISQGTLTIGIRIVSAKTASLTKEITEKLEDSSNKVPLDSAKLFLNPGKVLIRGPYRNGITKENPIAKAEKNDQPMNVFLEKNNKEIHNKDFDNKKIGNKDFFSNETVYNKSGYKESVTNQSVYNKLDYKESITNEFDNQELNNKTKDKKILILAKGAGTCPGIMAAKCLAGKNDVKLMANNGFLERKLCEKYLFNAAMCKFVDFDNSKIIQPFSNDSVIVGCELEQFSDNPNIWKPDLVIALGCNQFTSNVSATATMLYNDAAFFASSSHVICCGEGICGACGKVSTSNGIVPLCKIR